MKGSRRRSREVCLQKLYQWLLTASGVEELVAQLPEAQGYDKADREYLEILLRGTLHDVDALREKLQPCLDRKVGELSPIEHALLLMGAFELTSQPDTPYKVVINEAVELAKTYGGTDGYKYVNGVLDKLASELRAEEVRAHSTARTGQKR
jgi:N utilization substance protein B